MITKNKGVVVKINSISNYNFRANKTQDNQGARKFSKGDLLAMSGLAVAGTYTSALSEANKLIPQNTKKTVKEYFTKENFKSFAKHTVNIALITLVIASVVDFLHKDRKDAMDSLMLASMRE